MIKISRRSVDFNAKYIHCPKCHYLCGRHGVRKREIWSVLEIIKLTFGYYWCEECKRYFGHPGAVKLGGDKGKWSPAMKKLAHDLYKEDNTLSEATHRIKVLSGHYVAMTTVHEWWTAGDPDVDENTNNAGECLPEHSSAEDPDVVGEAPGRVLQEEGRSGDSPAGIPERRQGDRRSNQEIGRHGDPECRET